MTPLPCVFVLMFVVYEQQQLLITQNRNQQETLLTQNEKQATAVDNPQHTAAKKTTDHTVSTV